MPSGAYKRTQEQLLKLKEQGFQAGYTAWNKGMKGIRFSPNTDPNKDKHGGIKSDRLLPKAKLLPQPRL